MISLPKPLRDLSSNQLTILGVVGLLVVVLLIGSLQSGSAGDAPIGVPDQPFIVLAMLAFGGGLLSFLSPCTLPILPAYFAFAFQSGRTQIAANTVAFMLGVATMFSLLGATASAIGRVLYNFQDLILLAGGGVILIFGVMSLIGKGFSGLQSDDAGTRSTTFMGSYGFGLTFAVGWSSCIGPILGAMLIVASTTGSVVQGVFLLFIYTLGLGLPLILISTFLGRTSRKSLFWRILRGKGWDWTIHAMIVGVIWALAIWRILVAVADYYITREDALAVLSPVQEWGLFVVALVGVALWVFTKAGEKKVTLNLHSTQLVSGILFSFMGILMLNGTLASFNNLVDEDLAVWFAGYEEAFKANFENRFEILVTDTPVDPDAGRVTLYFDVITHKGWFQNTEWTDEVEFSFRQRTLNEGILVSFTNAGTLLDDPMKTIFVPPEELTIEVFFLTSLEPNTRLFTLTGLGGSSFESIDFSYFCKKNTCYIGEMDLTASRES